MNCVLKKIGIQAKVKSPFKFMNRSFDLIHYICSSILGFCAISSRPYSKCVYWCNECAEQFLPQETGFNVTLLEKVYFLFFMSYYIVDAFYINTASEFVIMVVHHITTLSLIALSVIQNLPVMCIAIMLLHDVVDLPLYTGKICLYLGFNNAKDIALVAFATLCFYFRDFNFPKITYLGIKNGIEMGADKLYFATMGLLIVLCCCHFVWSMKIVKAIIGIFKGSGIKDTRSD